MNTFLIVLVLLENKNDSTKIKYIPLWLVVKGIQSCPLYLYGIFQLVHQDLHVLHWVLVYNIQVP